MTPNRRPSAPGEQLAGSRIPAMGSPSAGSSPIRPETWAGSASVQLYRVTEAMRILGLSRSAIYRQFQSGRLRSVHQGRTRLVPAAAIADYVALLEREASGEQQDWRAG